MGDYQFSFFRLQICFNASILLVNERFLQSFIEADALPLCSINSERCGLASFHFRTRSATTVRIDETSVHTTFMPTNGGFLISLFQ